MFKNDVSDNELIVNYLKGHEACLEVLIKRHHRKIFSSIMILVRDKEMAEDVFQDTFIKVINTLKSGNYHEEGKFLPWVIRIAHNLVIDHFRRKNRMPMVHDTEDFSYIDALKLKDDNVEDRMIKDQIHHDVRMLVDHLPLDQREVVIMRHYADMSFKEIADSTNVSINTALGRMRYALINLRKLIEENKMVLSK